MKSHVGRWVGLGLAAALLPLGALLPAALVALTVGGFGPAGEGMGVPPASAIATASIPPEYLSLLVRIELRYRVAWPVLAGIYKIECDFGRSPDPGCNPRGTKNAAGAQGPGQFLPPTWRRGLGPSQLIPAGPATLDPADGYAADGDGDGLADPWDPADAMASTARMLATNGGVEGGGLRQALFAYNHDAAYGDHVLALASAYAGDPNGHS